ncbi:hypothetical protein a10_04513 [Streptomyces acidiscabies]|nr:hypothetical protein a10_04513 [Streptomyces acidiscabies]GAV41799.1 hypothetical protein Saa2_04713 [Streptomyces acidiscabies]
MSRDTKDMTMRKLAATTLLSLILAMPATTATAANHIEAKTQSTAIAGTGLPPESAHRSTNRAPSDPDADSNPATGFGVGSGVGTGAGQTGSSGSYGSGYATGIGGGTGGGGASGGGGGSSQYGGSGYGAGSGSGSSSSGAYRSDPGNDGFGGYSSARP